MKWLNKLYSPAIDYYVVIYQMLEYWIMWGKIIQRGVINWIQYCIFIIIAIFQNECYSKIKGVTSLVVDFSVDVALASFHFPVFLQ